MLLSAPIRPVLKVEPEWARIHRVADRLEPQLRQAFLRALNELRNKLPLDAIAEVLETGALNDLADIIQTLTVDAQKALAAVSTQAVKQVGQLTAAGMGFNFDIRNPQVVRWIDAQAGRLIQGVSQETRTAVRDIIRRGFVEGIAPEAQARHIRNLVGLTARDANTVDRMWQKLVDDGADLAFADRRAAKLTDRFIRRRARNIARTETIRAANMGQQMAWQQAADTGLLNRDQTFRVWIATGDSRTCPICAVLDGQTVGLTDNFASREQATGFETVGTGGEFGTESIFRITGTKPLKTPVNEQTPPAHPSCRCSVGLSFGGETSIGGEPPTAEPTIEQPVPPTVTAAFDGMENPAALQRELDDLMQRYPEVGDTLKGVTSSERLDLMPDDVQNRWASTVRRQQERGGVLGGVTYRYDDATQYIVLNAKNAGASVGGQGEIAILNHEFMHARFGNRYPGDLARRSAARIIMSDTEKAARGLYTKRNATDSAIGRIGDAFGHYGASDAEELASEMFAASREYAEHILPDNNPGIKFGRITATDVRTLLDAGEAAAETVELGNW